MPLPTAFVDPLSQLTQTLEVEEVSTGSRMSCQGLCGQVGRVEPQSGMTTIGQPDDDIRMCAAADRDDGQLLSAKRMMGMRDRHESRRDLERRGSALGMCRRSKTESCKRL